MSDTTGDSTPETVFLDIVVAKILDPDGKDQFKDILRHVEEEIVRKVHEGSGSNESLTARLLGVSRTTVRKYLGKGISK